MRQLSLSEIAQRIASERLPVFVCGAGVSIGAAPLAQSLEDGLFGAISKLARTSSNPVSIDDVNSARVEIGQEYLTLELLVSFIFYRVPDSRRVLAALYQKLFSLDAPTRTHRSIANAVSKRKPAIVLTSNFDDGLNKALYEAGLTSRMITSKNVGSSEPLELDICAFHGTVFIGNSSVEEHSYSRPTSTTARELAHPFDPQMANYIHSVFEMASSVYFLGYRGEDFYDFNPVLEAYIESGNTPDEQFIRRSKFVAIPHKGDIGNVSSFVRDTFVPGNVIKLATDSDSWLSQVCDIISEIPTRDEGLGAIGANEIESTFLELLEKHLTLIGMSKRKRASRMDQIKNQCGGIISDINSGILAAWTVTEYFRLESIGLNQQEIKAFGRPPLERKICDVSVGKLFSLQMDYWAFNASFRSARDDLDAVRTSLKNGVSLYDELRRVFEIVRQKISLQSRNMDNAVALMISAICSDYMGLIAMRVEPHLKDFAELEALREKWNTSDELFVRTESDSEAASSFLGQEARTMTSNSIESKEYSSSLQKLVGTRAWELIGRENFARSMIRAPQERVKLLQQVIEHRMTHLKSELDEANDDIDFSVPGHAGHCSLRIVELVRTIAGLEGEYGKPTFPDKEWGESLDTLMQVQVERMEFCLTISKSRSWQKHIRFLIGHDALLIAALFRGDVPEAKKVLERAGQYALGLSSTSQVLDQLRSRF